MMSLNEIEERFKPEMALILLILRVYFKRNKELEIKQFIDAYKIDWIIFEEIISVHQIRPVIYKVISGNNSGFPIVIFNAIKTRTLRLATGNLKNLEEIVRLHQLLNKNGVFNIPYKGVILSKMIFDDYLSRETSDIDFLIDGEHFSKAHQLMVADGYEPRFFNPDFEKQFLTSSHELIYSKRVSSGLQKIEIHWALTSKMMNISLPNKFLFSGLQNLKFFTEDISVFNVENHLMTILVHHGINDVWRSLKHLLDIAVLFEKYDTTIDWAGLQVLTRKYRINNSTGTGFQLAHQLFGTSIPEVYKTKKPLNSILIDNLLHYPSIKKGKLNIKNLKQQLFLRDSLKDKVTLLLAYLNTAITPNVRDMEVFKVPGNLYFLYYFLKPYRILFRRRSNSKGL